MFNFVNLIFYCYYRVQLRQRRLKRAMDLSLKQQYLPEHIQAVQKPFEGYLDELMNEFRVLRKERDRLTGGKFSY